MATGSDSGENKTYISEDTAANSSLLIYEPHEKVPSFLLSSDQKFIASKADRASPTNQTSGARTALQDRHPPFPVVRGCQRLPPTR